MKILVIQQKHIGDVLTSTIILEALAKEYPDAALHYLVNSHTTPVTENNPFIHKLQLFTPEIANSRRHYFSFLKTIRKENYDIVIDAYGKWSSVFISFFSKAPVRISYHKFYTSFFFTETAKILKTARHNAKLSVENRLALLAPLSIPFYPYKPKIYLTPEEIVKGKKFLEAAGLDIQKPVVMMGVLGSKAIKSYPKEYMATLIDHVTQRIPEVQLLFNYAPHQAEEAKLVYNLCKKETKNHIFYNAYPESLRMFMTVISHCQLFIGNEGGAANISKALSIPTFAVFSPVIGKEGWFGENERPVNNAVHISDFMEWNSADAKEAKKHPDVYYQKLTPEKILPELELFLKTNFFSKI